MEAIDILLWLLLAACVVAMSARWAASSTSRAEESKSEETCDSKNEEEAVYSFFDCEKSQTITLHGKWLARSVNIDRVSQGSLVYSSLARLSVMQLAKERYAIIMWSGIKNGETCLVGSKEEIKQNNGVRGTWFFLDDFANEANRVLCELGILGDSRVIQ